MPSPAQRGRPEPPPDKSMPRSVGREYCEALIIAAIFLSFANTFVVQTFYIPSGSMLNTLLIGDHLFVNRFIYGPAPTSLERKLLPLRQVARGDIVVFRSKENPSINVVKRCIGVPGDRIRVADKKLYINDKAVDDSSYAIHTEPFPPLNPALAVRDNFGPFKVPANSYFCMGDNRDNSWDSRFWGELPADYLMGRAFVIYWSYGGETSDGSWPGWGGKLRDLAKTAIGIPTKTRWSRTFRLVR
ncbi:MAG TPA: signal peptidase I [Thermoanaerobaculia bacterium]|nr:signal peptidase I [Thermoanaerobaculia bacterium]